MIVLKVAAFILGAFLFVAWWRWSLSSLSKASGWAEMVKLYHFSGVFQGKMYRFRSASFGGVYMQATFNMGVNEAGLYLVPILLYRFHHRPLLIPWDEIQSEPFSELVFEGYRLTFNSFPNTTLELSKRTFDNMLNYLKVKKGFQPGNQR